MAATEVAAKTKYVCSFCKGSAIEGILIPSDFSDRESCKDGKVFVARCDECSKYESDVDAAEALSKLFGWEIHRSMDKDDDTDPNARAASQTAPWYRPYFKVTIEEAEAAHKPKGGSSNARS